MTFDRERELMTLSNVFLAVWCVGCGYFFLHREPTHIVVKVIIAFAVVFVWAWWTVNFMTPSRRR